LTGRPGRPRTDQLARVERIVDVLVAEPTLSPTEVLRRVGGRKTDVLRVCRELRRLTEGRRSV
jgi:hypothetical protein